MAREHYRSAAHRTTQYLGPDDELPSADDAAADVLAADETRLVAAVQALPPPRETLVLRYYQGLALSEIAAALDVPLGTVKSRPRLAGPDRRPAAGRPHRRLNVAGGGRRAVPRAQPDAARQHRRERRAEPGGWLSVADARWVGGLAACQACSPWS